MGLDDYHCLVFLEGLLIVAPLAVKLLCILQSFEELSSSYLFKVVLS